MIAVRMTSILVVVFSCLSTWTLLSTAAKIECGKQLERKHRIIGGDRSYYGEFPWLVTLFGLNISRHMVLRCGGAIINKKWILTAAHCIFDNERPQDFEIHVKGYKLYPTKDDIQPIEMEVDKVISHQDYGYPMPFSNDIALIKLKEDIVLDKYAWPICLPTQSLNVTGKEAVVAGWGNLKEKGNRSQYQRKITVPIITNSQCDTWYKESGYKYHETEESQLCAGYEKGQKDSCQGDSGGPLFLKSKGDYTVVGIVSHAAGCAQPKRTGVYTRVSSYVNWIISNIRN